MMEKIWSSSSSTCSGSGALNYDHATDDDTIQIEAFVTADKIDEYSLTHYLNPEVAIIVIKSMEILC